jgi:hypothetical protein
MKEYSGVFGCPGYCREIDIFGIRMKNKIKIIRDKSLNLCSGGKLEAPPELSSSAVSSSLKSESKKL